MDRGNTDICCILLEFSGLFARGVRIQKIANTIYSEYAEHSYRGAFNKFHLIENQREEPKDAFRAVKYNLDKLALKNSL